MINNIPDEHPINTKNMTMQDVFRVDLKHVLNRLESVCMGSGDHRDYVDAYEYFVIHWEPKN